MPRVRASSSAVAIPTDPSRWRCSSAFGIASMSRSTAASRGGGGTPGAVTPRCYDPRRMSSEPLQQRPPRAGTTGRAAGRAARGVVWAVVLAVLAASGAGLAGLAWHPPGSPARAELTYEGDAALGARLDAATADLQQIAADVERLADAAKTALEDVASVDPARLEASLSSGDAIAAGIEARSRSLRESL